MSFIIYKVKCKICGHRFNTAFDIVGTRIIAQLAKKCPKCKAVIQEKLRVVRYSKAIFTLGGKIQKLARS